MTDFTRLTSGLSLHESRHVLRYLFAVLGGRSAGSYDPAIAESALARLSDEQREALESYCRGYGLGKRELSTTH